MQKGVALVTGASGGLGESLARDLASRGYDIVLTARSAVQMQVIAEAIKEMHKVDVTVIPLDMSLQGSAAKLVQILDERGIAPSVLVNNAAFGLHCDFLAMEPGQLSSLIQLNVTSLAELTFLLGGRMKMAGRGNILMVSSGAAFQAAPTMAAYGASKAFVQSLGEALHVELGPHVGVTVVSPGPMETGFNKVSGLKLSATARRAVLTTEDVAKAGLDAMFAGKSGIIPGGLNKLGAFINRLVPRHTAAKMFVATV